MDVQGARGDDDYVAFSDAIKAALAQAEIDAVATIKAASGKSWQAAAWHLERSYPKRWGRRDPGMVDMRFREFLQSKEWQEFSDTMIEAFAANYPGGKDAIRTDLDKCIKSAEEHERQDEVIGIRKRP